MGNEDDQAEVGVHLDAFPEPAVRYAVRDDTVILLTENKRFADSFDSLGAETPLRQWFDMNGVTVRGHTIDDVCSALIVGDVLDVVVTVGCLDDATYRLRSVDEPGPIADGTIGFSAGPDLAQNTPASEQIAGVVSHDLRNPLDVAKARSRAARETGDAEHFVRLEMAHERMERIIKDVLTLARSDDVITPSEEVGLRDIATNAWATVNTDSATLTIEDELPNARVDADSVQRLFENLFRNSVKHASTGRGTRDSSTEPTDITVRVGSIPDGFFIADDGPGIPSEERESVFKPGYSASDSGTGLGLTIVKRIAKAHNWTVSLVDSTDGTRFEFSKVSSGSATTSEKKHHSNEY